MAVKNIYELYKCEICGNISEILFVGGGELVCCGKPMVLQEEKTNDVGNEKHVPVIEKSEKGIKVKVGEKEHPMEENHYIQWIEVITDRGSFKKFLNPGEKPETEFFFEGKFLRAREYCNIHGFWKKEEDN